MSKEQAIPFQADPRFPVVGQPHVLRTAEVAYKAGQQSILDFLEERAEGVEHDKYRRTFLEAKSRMVCYATCLRCALDKEYEKLKEMIG